MKNLYKIVFLLLGMAGFSQNLQNNNWYFGKDNWVNFDNVTANPSNVGLLPFSDVSGSDSGLNLQEGCASVSDENGNLLFITDGKKVYRLQGGQFQLITNALNGHSSSAQNVIIVPKPLSNRRYYIITMTGATTRNSGSATGLYYSELDFSGLTGGTIVSLNTPLQDNNGISIDDSYGNTSECITSIIDESCNEVWVVTHVQNFVSEGGIDQNTNGKFLAYKVSSAGITGASVSFLPFAIPGDPGFQFAFSMKVSRGSIANNIHRLGLTTNGGLGVFAGTFDTSSGAFVMNNTSLAGSVGTNAYGLEFSPNTRYLYYSMLSPSQVVVRFDFTNNSSQSSGAEFSSRYGALQLAYDNNIYVTSQEIDASFASLKVVVNPDSIAPFSLDSFAINNFSNSGLPQWVWESCCLPTLVLQSPIDNVNNNSSVSVSLRERSNWIKASNIVNVGNAMAGDAVVYHAGNFVELNPGFEAVAGSQFTAYIEGCSGDFVYKTTDDAKDDNSFETEPLITKIKLYPNPTNNYITVDYTVGFNQIRITSIDGKTVFNQKSDISNSKQIDVSNLKNGIYTLSIVTTEGAVLTEKLIKN